MAKKKESLNTKIIRLVVLVLICEGVGIVGSLVTVPAITGWYMGLNKPFFSPPNWIFGPVWTTLYLLMGVSWFLVWSKKISKKWFYIQLALNFLWSYIFFGLHNAGLALAEILFMWIAIVMTIRDFYKTSRTASWLLVPYVLWVSFAAFLNFSIWVLN